MKGEGPWNPRWLLLGMVLLVYARSLFGAFQFDDFNVIVHNPAVHDLGRWHHGLRPLLKLTYAVNWAVDPAPLGFLLVNVAVHALNAWLVYALILALAPRFGFRERPEVPALMGALVFALHPVQTEAVAYVSGRSTSFMATWFLSAILLSVQARNVAAPWARLAGAWLGFILAVATKETALVLPAVVFLIHREDAAGERRRILGGFFILGGLLILGLLLHPGYRHLLRFSFELRDATAQVKGALVGGAYLMRKLLWPTSLNIDPPLAIPVGWTWEGLGMVVLLLASVGVAVVTFRRRAWLSLGIGWFLLTLLPSIGSVPRLDLANERHLYLPLVGIAWLVAGACQEARLRRFALPGVAAACLAMGVATYVRIGDYKSEVALWESSLRAGPGNARAHNNLGTALALAGRREEAREAFRQALRLRPNYALAEENLRGLD